MAKLIIYAQVPALVVVPLSNRVGHKKKQLKNTVFKLVIVEVGPVTLVKRQVTVLVLVVVIHVATSSRLNSTIQFSFLLIGIIHSGNMVNVDDELLDVCAHRIAQQRTFDKKPLGLAMCYGCGHLLWSCVDGAHTFLVNKPSGMSADEAPASAFL